MVARPRIAIAGFQHETNTFAPFGATFQDFKNADGWPALTLGADILSVFPRVNIPIGGFINAASDFELVPIAWASAEPCSYVSDDAFERMSDLICGGIAGAGQVDGVYLDLHGAMVSESHEDGEGELLRRIRHRIGPEIPVVVTLDMHANVTRAMVDLSDAMTVYRTYPHIDMAETGRRSCSLLRHRLRSGLPLHKSLRKLPFLIPLSAQCTTMAPCDSLYGMLPGLEGAGVLSVDLAIGFPMADIFDCGPAVIAYGTDAPAVDRAAEWLFDAVVAAEPDFHVDMLPPREAVRIAMRQGRPGEPIVLADVQDNPGGGGTSDTLALLQALVDQNAQKASLAMLWDPAAAVAAHAAGIGGEIELSLGGRYGYDPQPFMGRFKVEALTDGAFPGTGEIFRDVQLALGPTALLRVLDRSADVTVVVCSTRFQCLDLSLFRAHGVEPTEQAILAVKSTVHFRADFEPIAQDIILVEAPGACLCRIDKIKYRHLRPGLRLGPASPSATRKGRRG